MKQLEKDLRVFLQNKIYLFCVSITALCSYGFAIIQPSIGIDDTAVATYLEDGLEVVMGRWTVFLLNKLFHVSDFAPFMTELVGVLFLVLAATLFGVLFCRIAGEVSTGSAAGDNDGIRVGMPAVVFACVFVSSPIISEVFVYYWHDGVGLGYVFTALSLLAFFAALKILLPGRPNQGNDGQTDWKQVGLSLGKSLLWIWLAVGCYESFLILYILGILVILFLHGSRSVKGISIGRGFMVLFMGALLTILCVALRSVMIVLITQVYGLQHILNDLKVYQRGLADIMSLFTADGLDNLIMLAKRFWVVYHLNAVVYLPITVYELAVWIFGIYSIFLTVKKRNLWFLVLFVGMLVTPFLLTVAEMRLTYYRSCQYLPFFAAAGLWLLCTWGCSIRTKKGTGRRFLKVVLAVFGCILVWNQAECMNRSFYTDYKKYQSSKELLCNITYEIEREYGTDIPVVFTGHYSTPDVYLEDSYVSYGSWQYRVIATITDKIDPHLKEKYFAPRGYSFVGEANFPMIQWALDAFDGTNREMINFLQMHGHDFPLVTDPEVYEEARKLAVSMPGWPAEGSIVLEDGYILVKIDR